MGFIDRVREWFRPPEPLAPGLYHYQTEPDLAQQYRLHLRVEKNGQGVLLINAAKLLHLNQTATEHAKLILEEKPAEEAARQIARRYDVSRQTALADYEQLRAAIVSIAQAGEEACPVTYLDLDQVDPMSAEISAPYRMDLALTYRCQNDCPHCYVGRPRDFAEMSAEQWRRVIDRCWDLGIPILPSPVARRPFALTCQSWSGTPRISAW